MTASYKRQVLEPVRLLAVWLFVTGRRPPHGGAEASERGATRAICPAIPILAAGTGVSKKRGPGRPRRPERLKKAPGEPVDHRLTPKMRVAILAIVEDNKSPAEAAKVAGLNGVPKALAPRSEADRNG